MGRDWRVKAIFRAIGDAGITEPAATQNATVGRGLVRPSGLSVKKLPR
jgi:hypothetical protein